METMKIMRYRIRIVTLLLVSALLILLFWTVRAAWIPSLSISLPSVATDAASVSPAVFPSPAASVSPDVLPSPSSFAAEPTPSPAPLYDTFGL